jgi:Kef-type K+ transport system membrane component KefB
VEILLVIMIIVGSARLGGELMERLSLPGLLGELLVGVFLGFLLLMAPGKTMEMLKIQEDQFFRGLLDVAIFFLMFMAGLEVRLRDVVQASRVGIPVAIGGVVVPLLLGIWVGWIFIPPSQYKFSQSLFLGVALAITAIPVSVRALMDLGHLRSRVGTTIINAAVIDDIIGIVLLGFLTTFLSAGSVPSASSALQVLGRPLLFFGIAVPVALYVVPFIDRRLPSGKSAELHLTVGICFGLAMAILAELLGLHFMIGAFVGGLLLSEWTIRSTALLENMMEKVSGVTLGFLAPIFFVSIGLHLDLSAFSEALWFTISLLAVAIAGKVLGSSLPARLAGVTWRESIAIGIGMNGRGAVELVVASVALEAGLFTQPVPPPPVVSAMFSAVVIVAIITTLMTPIGLRVLLRPPEVPKAT